MSALVQWVNDHPRATDAIVTLFVITFAGVGLLIHWGEGDSTLSVIAGCIAVLAAASSWFRRNNPLCVLLCIAGAHLLLTWVIGNEYALVPAVAVGLFTAARFGNRPVGLTVAIATGLALAVGTTVLGSDPFLAEFGGEVVRAAVPIAIGDAVRSRADRLRTIIDTEANARVQAERIRIARDLHDVVAHGLSTIAIQSGVAAHLLESDPTQAKGALDVINATGKNALEELRAMVGALRSTDEAPLRPTPTDPNDLTELLAGASNAGIDLSTEVTGSFPAHAGDSCVVALHRIIQEALTNVARHAGGAATTVRIDHSTDRVEVHITNARGIAAGRAPGTTGVGIIGMRERAESLGGTLTAAQRSDGGFRVGAVLPYNPSREATS